MYKILFVHLLNDYSGSPKVLSQVISGVAQKHDIELFTAKGEKGFLNCSTQNYHHYSYQRYNNKILTLISLIVSQVQLFVKIFNRRKKYEVIYINTMLPFGAAIAAKVCKKEVIFHIHETSIKPDIFKSFLRLIIQKTASKLIFVSNSLQEQETFNKKEEWVIYNSLDESFLAKAKKFSRIGKAEEFRVLMVCSLKDYKGVKEFTQIAKICKKITFTLVLNSTKEEIDRYFSKLEKPLNVIIWSKQADVHPFYEDASLVLNLSRPDQWVETFGLTIVEALAYRLPVIVPPVGGPAEIVRDGVEGFLISCYEKDTIAEKIKELSENKKLYQNLSNNAFKRATDFKEETFHKKILSVVDE